MTKPSFVYVTYIASTPEKVFRAIVDPEIACQFWRDPTGDGPARENVSDWKKGSRWQHRRHGTHEVDVAGNVLESTPPRKLVLTWARPSEVDDETKHSRVTFDVEQHGNLVRLTVTHEDLEKDPRMLESISGGWPKILANLKTLLETGHSLERTDS
jgi:uncharacterized protein YndB with AHSA1/START domain